MGNRIPRSTKVIKATFKVDSLKYLGTLVCTPSYSSGWRGLGADGKWYQIFTSYLRNSNICDIECFDSWDAYNNANMEVIK